MEKFIIEIQRFENLTKEEQEQAANNGCGKEYASYLRVVHNGRLILLESDAMEPEDARFHRDLLWIKDALQKCYEIGKRGY